MSKTEQPPSINPHKELPNNTEYMNLLRLIIKYLSQDPNFVDFMNTKEMNTSYDKIQQTEVKP